MNQNYFNKTQTIKNNNTLLITSKQEPKNLTNSKDYTVIINKEKELFLISSKLLKL